MEKLGTEVSDADDRISHVKTPTTGEISDMLFGTNHKTNGYQIIS